MEGDASRTRRATLLKNFDFKSSSLFYCCSELPEGGLQKFLNRES
jgi:hypothetical protein